MLWVSKKKKYCTRSCGILNLNLPVVDSAVWVREEHAAEVIAPEQFLVMSQDLAMTRLEVTLSFDFGVMQLEQAM